MSGTPSDHACTTRRRPRSPPGRVLPRFLDPDEGGSRPRETVYPITPASASHQFRYSWLLPIQTVQTEEVLRDMVWAPLAFDGKLLGEVLRIFTSR